MPLVSIITPVYNAAPWLRETLASVRAQTLTDWEQILVDDGSSDNSVAIAEAAAKQDARFRLIRTPQNMGPSSARNLAIEAARGRFIAFLDADDYWEPHKLSRQLDLLERHPEVGLTAARYYEETPGTPRVPLSYPPAPFFDRVVRETIRFAIKAFEVGGVRDKRSRRRRLRRLEYGRAQQPPRGFAASPRLCNALGRGQRATSRKPREAPGRFADFPFRRFPCVRRVARRARGRLHEAHKLD